MGLSTSPAPGARVGPYELMRELGQGGFASVWLARRTGPGGFEARVAIKLIRKDLGRNPMFQKMFLDEARLVANINHPNVVNIFELGQEGELLYLVMEYIRGRALAGLADLVEHQKRRVPVGILMRVLADTCAGLHAAHELKREGKHLEVIHRDVSPQNILVSDKGTVKLIDFGVAKANDRLAGDTEEGLAKGKIRYMSPEQAMAKPLDRRVDIYAVGAVAYDLLEGRAPFDGPNDVARVWSLVGTTEAPPMESGVHSAFKDVIQRAISRDPDSRYATAAELRGAIEKALERAGERVSSDDVAAFFGEWLMPRNEMSTGPNETNILRELVAGPAKQKGALTEDVPAPEPLRSSRPPAPHPTISAPPPAPRPRNTQETLDALDASGLRKPNRVWLPLVAAVVALGGFAFWRVGHSAGAARSSAETSVSPAGANGTMASAPKTAVSIPMPEPDLASTPTTTIDLDTVSPASSAASVAPPARAKGPRPRPTSGQPKARPGAPRPKYDDTIQ